MATKADVEGVFSTLRDDLQAKIDSGNYNAWFEELRRLHLAVATALREFQQRPANGDASEAYDPALAAGKDAAASSQALAPQNEVGLRRLQQLVIHAVNELQLITATAPAPTVARTFAAGLRGSLRVSPQARPELAQQVQSGAPTLAATAGALAPHATASLATVQTQPTYIASVAALFPLEAATLYPLGKSIAQGNGFAFAIVIVLIVAFIIVLRYFATQPEGGGPPAVTEIIIAVISFLLWVGALGGYWVTKPIVDWKIPLDLGEKLFGFAIIMWVAIVPYFVRKPTAPATP